MNALPYLPSFTARTAFGAPGPFAHPEGGPLVKILLVSEDPELRSDLPAALADSEFLVEATEDRLGNRRARTARHEAIVLDVASPDDGKIHWIADWRQRGIASKVLLLFSESIRADECLRCLEMGGDDFLRKPFQSDELEARLWVLLRDLRKSAGIYRVDELEVDPSRLTVRRDSKLIRLTAREFALLQFLIQRRGQVLPRAAIVQHLYQHLGGARPSNVVDVHVSNLRKKIDGGFVRPLILTRWGQGYEFRGPEELS